MAESLDDCEFWLPEFLTGDEILMEKNSGVKKCIKDGYGTERDGGRGFMPCEFPYGGHGSLGFGSDLSSPVESVVGSAETESDEEDFITELTRQMAHYTPKDASRRPNAGFAAENTKAWVMAGSPQSTLCAAGNGCGCRKGSSRGSPNESSQLSSLPATWDLLYAAAGEVARMRMNEEGFGNHQSRGLLGPARKPSQISIPMKNPNRDFGFFPDQPISQHQFQASQIQQLKQQMMKQRSQALWGEQLKAAVSFDQQAHQMVQNKARNAEIASNRSSRPVGLSVSAWPPLQQQQQQQQQNQQKNGSGMRAVFLGTPSSKRECAGTGVFLPRRVGYPQEPKKKPACSTVLLPARVVHALNLNLDEMSGAKPQIQPRFNGGFTPDSDAALRIRSNNVMLAQQKRTVRSQPVMNHEIRLPQEWTY